MRPKNRELHELPYTEMVKSGTIRLTTGYVRPSTPDNTLYEDALLSNDFLSLF